MSPLVTMDWGSPEGKDERRARAWEVNQRIYSSSPSAPRKRGRRPRVRGKSL